MTERECIDPSFGGMVDMELLSGISSTSEQNFSVNLR